MAIGDKDHGRVAMPIAAMFLGAVHQALDLALGEIASLDCQVYDVWCAFFGCRFHADKPCLRVPYCIGYTRLLHRATLHDRLRDQPARRAHPTPGKAVCRSYGTQLASTIRYGPAGPTARNRRSYFSCGVRGNGSVAGALPDPVRDGGTP